MKFRQIFRFEFSSQFRSVSTWLYLSALLVLILILKLSSSDSSAETYSNSPSVIAFVSMLGNMIWLMTAGAVAGKAAARDVQSRIYFLTYTTPISKVEYLGGRFFAAVAINAMILLAIPLGLLIAFYFPGIESGSMGPFRPAAYLTAYAFIALPTMIIATAIQFSFAIWGGRAITSYIASVLILITSQFISTTVGQLAGSWEWTKLLDLIGLTGIGRDMETWTVAEKNTRLITLEGVFLYNRLLWLTIAIIIFGFAFLGFRFREVKLKLWRGKRHKRKQRDLQPTGPATDKDAEPGSPAVAVQISRAYKKPEFGLYVYARQVFVLTWTSFKLIVKSRLWLMLVSALALVVILFAPEFMEFQGVPIIPRTSEMISFLTATLGNVRSPLVIIPLLIMYYAGELVWRERVTGIDEITDTAPVPEWVLFLGKFLGLGGILVLWMAVLILIGIITQWGFGYSHFEFALYAKALFGLQLVNYLLFVLLALAVHVAVNQKYVAHMVTLIAWALIAFAPQLGIEHKLIIYGSDPGWTFSDMRGFEPFIKPWILYKAYWLGSGLLLAAATRLLWVRGRENKPQMRLRKACHRLKRHIAIPIVIGLSLMILFGSFIFYNTNVLNNYTTAPERLKWRARYERQYGKFATAPKPQLCAMKLEVAIFPSERKVDIKGDYQLVNSTRVPLDSIHLATASEVETKAVSFDQTATSLLEDKELGHRIYLLKEPLQPGDSLQLHFEVQYKLQGFSNRGLNTAVVSNATYFTSHDWLPAIGYQPSRELLDAGLRKKYGLPFKLMRPSVYDLEAREVVREGQVRLETVVSTDKDQTAIAPGTLLKTWSKDGRRYFHYATETPIKNGFAIYSSNYALEEGTWTPPAGKGVSADEAGGSVGIQLFYYPVHKENLDRMLESIKASLDYYTANFGPYPFSQIRLVEHPGHGFGMHSESTTIDYEEGFSLIAPNSKSLDLVSYVVAHEVAHQWWGAAQLIPAGVEGAIVMTESFACYSGLKVMEKAYGREQVSKLLSLWKESYEVPRSRANAPLLRALDPFLGYRKGPMALYALSKYIGEDKVNLALRELLKKYGSAKPPLATTLDLYQELKTITPDSLHYLLHDLFEVNTYWELETENVEAEKTMAGAWEVILNLVGRKVVVDTTGTESEVPMNDWIEIGIFGEGKPKPFFLQKHRIHSGKQSIQVTVPFPPARAGVDPNDLLIDLEPEDNIKRVSNKK